MTHEKPSNFRFMSSPTGETFTFKHQGVPKTLVVKQQNFSDVCGQAYLEMLGYQIPELASENIKVSGEDLIKYAHATESEDWWQDNYRYDGPHLKLGIKKSTGNPHWYLRVGDNVINSEDGLVEKASDYETREIDFDLAVYIVPFNYPNKI